MGRVRGPVEIRERGGPAAEVPDCRVRRDSVRGVPMAEEASCSRTEFIGDRCLETLD